MKLINIANELHLFYIRGFRTNQGIFEHTIGGLLLAILFHFFGASNGLALWGVFLLAFSLEVYQVFALSNKGGVTAIYGSIRFWLYDSLGDILGAMIAATLYLLCV